MTRKTEKILKDSQEKGIPIFVLTAKDMIAYPTLIRYRKQCKMDNCTAEHMEGVDEVVKEFEEWMKKNPDSVKLPD
jgi:hypothetical protein